MLTLIFVGLYLIVFIFGMTIGSFLNVCIFRLPKNESLIKRSSHCMTCGASIKWYDLVPIFSWLFLRGKCRNCGEKISGRYPLVESLNAIMYLAVFFTIGMENCLFNIEAALHAIVLCLFFSALIVIGFIDFDTQEMDLSVLLIIAALAIPDYLIDQFLGDSNTLVQRLLGAAIISIPFLLIGLITGGMGMGDVVLMAGGGLLLGMKSTVVAAFIGIMLAAIIGLILKLALKKDSRIAFGPYLAVGLVAGALWGERIADWYLTTMFIQE